MANRLTFNKLLKKIHFFASIVIFMFALMYIVSGLVLAKHEWFPLGKTKTIINTYALNYAPDTSNLKKFGNEIKQQFELSGRLEYRRDWKKQIKFNIGRPGTYHDITIHNKLDSLTIKTNERKTFGEISKRIHRTHGFSGGLKYVLWAILVDISALAFIIFSITGILIWYRSRKAFKWGWFILIPTFILLIVMFVYLS